MVYPAYKYHRKSIRLRNYDYSQNGNYFITICTYNREPLFGNIANGKMILTEYGEIVQKEWKKSEHIRKEIVLDEFIIMPNHFHAIVVIESSANTVGIRPFNDSSSADILSSRLNMGAQSLASVIVGFKASVTRKIHKLRQIPDEKVWQRNYYEHIVRNEDELHRIQEYIRMNVAQWHEDQYNPINVSANNKGGNNVITQ